ncbi:hypothetical protein CHS0354_035589 [Potamilus streckersoni]|uniref:Uncharacterized protein n=1 Tax=Potamilus streckersoni TaxID=2493646 RepID=A0AAE0RT96_9BIVA|nr:hypothetical protein CHS0354_035589 [Potamilus streckersoni]
MTVLIVLGLTEIEGRTEPVYATKADVSSFSSRAIDADVNDMASFPYATRALKKSGLDMFELVNKPNTLQFLMTKVHKATAVRIPVPR